jgi:PKD repeat protein
MTRLKFLFLCLCSILYIGVKAQIPVFNSLPGSNYVIYLDFDGEIVDNLWWSDSTINALAPDLTSTKILEVLNRVAEDFRPFDINVSSEFSVFTNADITKRIRVIVTSSSDWYGSAGGVAYVSSFGADPELPCWVFSNMLGNSASNNANAASHEVGHTLGLYHHARFDNTCTQTDDYHSGNGTGETSWGPIMGAPYSKNMVLWYKGAADGTICSDYEQDDLDIITTLNGFTYRNDDVSNNTATADLLNIINNSVSDSGLIEKNDDKDLYKIVLNQNYNITLNAKPYNVNSNGNKGSNLDIKLEFLNSQGNQIAIDTPSANLNAGITLNTLSAGTYYVRIDGMGISNYSDFGNLGAYDYGSLGKYFITATLTPLGFTLPDANFSVSTTGCVGQTITLTNTSSNSTSYSWIISDASPSVSSAMNPTITYTSVGVKTIKLIAFNGNVSDTIVKSITISCTTPTTVSAGSITNNTALINWSLGDCALKSRLQYRQLGTSTWTTFIIPSSSNSKSLVGLNPGTVYSYRVKSQCTSNGVILSSWSPIQSFTTTGVLCNTPNNISFVINSSSSVTVNWAAATGAVKYRLRYKASSSSTWISIVVSAPSLSKIITGLSPNTTYNFEMRVQCDENATVFSPYSATQNFTTSSLREVEIGAELYSDTDQDFSIIPNPAQSEFKLLLDNFKGEEIQIQIFDIIGREIFTSRSNNNEIINLNPELSKGIYLINISDSISNVSKRLIIE